MGDLHARSPFTQPSLPPPPPPPPLLQPKSNMPMLYYGLVVIGTAALVLALYNLIIIKWCTQRNSQRQQRPNSFLEISTSNHEGYENNLNRNLLLSSFKYKKESGLTQDQQGGGGGGGDVVDYECAVCLSVFEEGEEVRKLPRCKHSFHALCIDMWLYSHSDCPLCRAPVGQRCQRHVVYTQQASSRGLLDSNTSA